MTHRASRNRVNCLSSLAGHNVHCIQALRSADDVADHPRRPGRLLRVHEVGWSTVELDHGGPVRLWHHRPDHLLRSASRNGSGVWYQARWSLLGATSGDGVHLFSVTRTAGFIPSRPAREQAGECLGAFN